MDIPGKTEEMLNQMIVGSWVIQAIHVAAEIGIADFLADGPRTADELARETKTHGASLYRVLRALASIGIFNEDAEGRFSLTPMGKLLGSDDFLQIGSGVGRCIPASPRPPRLG